MTEMKLNALDSPIMKAWEKYRASDEFRNSFKWAAELEHRTGSMWAAFAEGFAAAENSTSIPAQGQNDEFGYYDLGQSFLEEYECAVKDGCLKDFVCAESPVEVIWHLINAKDQAVLDFANSILHGDDEHRGWLQEAARAFVAGHPLPPPRASAPPQESETVAVPKSALEWLFGSGPDEDGKWFGECEDIERATPRKFSHTYWWRSKFRKLIGYAPRYDKVTRTIVRDTAPNHSQEATKP